MHSTTPINDHFRKTISIQLYSGTPINCRGTPIKELKCLVNFGSMKLICQQISNQGNKVIRGNEFVSVKCRINFRAIVNVFRGEAEEHVYNCEKVYEAILQKQIHSREAFYSSRLIFNNKSTIDSNFIRHCNFLIGGPRQYHNNNYYYLKLIFQYIHHSIIKNYINTLLLSILITGILLLLLNNCIIQY